MEWIYIATNDFYALERLWKVGSTIRLSSRIGGYHTGRAKGVGDGYSSFLTFGQKRLRSPASPQQLYQNKVRSEPRRRRCHPTTIGLQETNLPDWRTH
jgi:hypothetical protein